MTRNLNGTRNLNVKRTQTLDRRRGYRSPTDTDIRCPFFDDTFFRLGKADVVDDMIAVCKDETSAVCDYKQDIVPGQLCACKRYWKEDFEQMSALPPTEEELKEQNLHVKYTYIREFIGKEANVTAKVYLKNNLGAWLENVTWNDFPAIGANDWSMVPGTNEIVTTANTGRSYLLYNKQNAEQLRDYTFSVKGYVEGNGDRDWVGIIFRYTPNGHYRLWWDGGDNGTTLRLTYHDGSWNQYDLWNKYANWFPGVHYEYHVELEGNKIRCSVKVKGASTWIVDQTVTDTRAGHGTFGVYAESQAGTHFYDISGSGGLVVTSSEISELSQNITLRYNENIDVSDSIHDYFIEAIDRVMRDIQYRDYTIDHVVYQIVSDNVYESLYFNGSTNTITQNGDDKITMQTFEYNQVFYKEFDMTIAADANTPQTHNTLFEKDCTLTQIDVTATAQNFTDSFYIASNANPVYTVDNVVLPTYHSDQELNLIPDTMIPFVYLPKNMRLDYFTGPSIDTHRKRYRIVNNDLGWHADDL